jgi:hypothetical protein
MSKEINHLLKKYMNNETSISKIRKNIMSFACRRLPRNFRPIRELLKDLTPKTILVDPAGSAFSGPSTFCGGALSGAIYGMFDIYGTEHGLGQIEAGEAKFNDKLDYDKLSPKIKGMVHAVGPNGGSKATFDAKLEKTVLAVGKAIYKKFKNEKDLEIRIPMISAGLFSISEYSGSPENLKTYFEMYMPLVFKYLCRPFASRGFTIKMGIWSREEIAGWKMFLG